MGEITVVLKQKDCLFYTFNKTKNIFMAKSTKTKKNKPTSKEQTKAKKAKLPNDLGENILFSVATTGRHNFYLSVPQMCYRDYICYTIAELRRFIDAADLELSNLNVIEKNRAIAIFPLIDSSYQNKISVGFTSCAIVSNNSNVEFKHQFNTLLPNQTTDPLNPFNGNGNDLDAYNHGQGYPFIPTPKKKK